MSEPAGGALARARPSVATRPPGGRRRRGRVGGDPLGRHRIDAGVGAGRRCRACRRRAAWPRPPSHAARERPSSSGWAAASALGLYLGVPETDHVVGVAAVLAVLVLASLAAPGRASWVLVVGLDVVLAWAAVRGAPGGGPALVAGLAMPGLLVVAPLTSHLPGPRRALVPAACPACRVGRAAGRLRRRRRPQRGAQPTRSPRPRRSPPLALVVLVVARPPRRRIPVVVKRAIDVVVAATLLVVTAPLLAAIAVVVRIVDGPPVLFRQARSGRGGRPFELVKFRTMRPARPDEAGPQHDAARLTRVGRFLRATSLDELPTLVHVVRGEMALVGPRPLPVTYLPRYDDTQARRLEVRPGITGWAQVNGRNTTGWDERLAMDVWYVDHASLALDVRILARTVGMVLRGDGIDHAPGVTMTEFRRARRRAGRRCRRGRCASPT